MEEKVVEENGTQPQEEVEKKMAGISPAIVQQRIITLSQQRQQAHALVLELSAKLDEATASVNRYDGAMAGLQSILNEGNE